jgi:hypothetical protein
MRPATFGSPHGTKSRYTNGKCRCPRCRRAWREGTREATDRIRANRLGEGLTTDGARRKTFYDQAALDLMARFGVEPDPRFLLPEDSGH